MDKIHNDPMPLASILARALRRYDYDATVDGALVENAYRQVVGPFLFKLTWRIRFDAPTGILFLQLGSAAMRQEFSLKTGDLMQAINRRVGTEAVKRIVLQ